MGALFDHPTLVEHGNAIRQVQRRASMGDEQGRASPHDLAQRRVDPLFHLGVDRARGVVEDQYPRVGEDGPRKSDPLALAARQGEAALSDDRVVSPRELRDELVRLRGPRGGLDFLECGVRLAICDVRPHAVGEEEALFEHDTDLAAQRRDCDVADVVPVDAQSARAHLVKARHHIGHSRLAASARAYESHGLAGRDAKLETTEHRRSVAVGESDIVEHHLAHDRRQFNCPGGIDDSRL